VLSILLQVTVPVPAPDLGVPVPVPNSAGDAANVSAAVAAREASRRFDWKQVVGMDDDRAVHVLWKPCVQNDFSETEVTSEAWFEDTPGYDATKIPENVEFTVNGLKMASQLKGATIYVFEKGTDVHYEVAVKSYSSRDRTHRVKHVGDGYAESLNLFSEWAWIRKEHFKC
jgi:hypothetical protein